MIVCMKCEMGHGTGEGSFIIHQSVPANGIFFWSGAPPAPSPLPSVDATRVVFPVIPFPIPGFFRQVLEPLLEEQDR